MAACEMDLATKLNNNITSSTRGTALTKNISSFRLGGIGELQTYFVSPNEQSRSTSTTATTTAGSTRFEDNKYSNNNASAGAGARRQLFRTGNMLKDPKLLLQQQQLTRAAVCHHEEYFDNLDIQNLYSLSESIGHSSSSPCCLYSNSNSFILGNCVRESKRTFSSSSSSSEQQHPLFCSNCDITEKSTVGESGFSGGELASKLNDLLKADGARTEYASDLTEQKTTFTPKASGYPRPQNNSLRMHLALSPVHRTFFSKVNNKDVDDNNTGVSMASFERLSLMESLSHHQTSTNLIPPGMPAVREMLKSTGPPPSQLNQSHPSSTEDSSILLQNQSLVASTMYGLTECSAQKPLLDQTAAAAAAAGSQRSMRLGYPLDINKQSQNSFIKQQHASGSDATDLEFLLRLQKCTTEIERKRQILGDKSTCTHNEELAILPSFSHNNNRNSSKALISNNKDYSYVVDCGTSSQQYRQALGSFCTYQSNPSMLMCMGNKPGQTTAAQAGVCTQKLTLLCTSRIVDVWAHNLENEFTKIRDIVEKYQYVAVDTEFPGVVALPTAACSEYHYKTIKYNVDLLKIIQLGITFADEKGAFPEGISTWQFNFKFDLKKDMYAENSINFLQENGINFQMHQNDGIDIHEFGEMIMSSGLVMSKDVKWISFHGSYDFGYLMKLLTCAPLPDSEQEFFVLLRDYFPSLYDIKYLLKNCKEFTSSSSLQKLAERFKVTRVGPQHQAGSDSLVTCQTFFRLIETCFSNLIDDSVFSGAIYGLGNKFHHKTEAAASVYYRSDNDKLAKETVATAITPAIQLSPTLISKRNNFIFRSNNQTNVQAAASGVDSLLCSQDVPMLVVGIGNTKNTAVLS